MLASISKIRTIFSTIILLISLDTFSCDCEPYSIQVQSTSVIEYTDLIFIGELIDQNEQDRTYKLKVINQYKGPGKEFYTGTDIISANDTSMVISGCSWWSFKIGEKYLIYASFSNNKPGMIFIHQCSLTRSITQPHHHFSYDSNIELEMYKFEVDNSEENMLEEELSEIARRELEQEIGYLEKLKTR